MMGSILLYRNTTYTLVHTHTHKHAPIQTYRVPCMILDAKNPTVTCLYTVVNKCSKNVFSSDCKINNDKKKFIYIYTNEYISNEL